jgi:hypothetical protein
MPSFSSIFACICACVSVAVPVCVCVLCVVCVCIGLNNMTAGKHKKKNSSTRSVVSCGSPRGSFVLIKYVSAQYSY